MTNCDNVACLLDPGAVDLVDKKKGGELLPAHPFRGTAQFACLFSHLPSYQRTTKPSPYIRPCMMLFGAR